MQKWWWVGLVVGWTMIGQRGEASVLIAQASCGGNSNIEMLQCARERYEASDRQLNQVYKQVRSKIGASEQELLIDAQVAWSKYRDQGCEMETYGSRGASGHRGFKNACLERVTHVRSMELEAYLRNR